MNLFLCRPLDSYCCVPTLVWYASAVGKHSIDEWVAIFGNGVYDVPINCHSVVIVFAHAVLVLFFLQHGAFVLSFCLVFTEWINLNPDISSSSCDLKQKNSKPHQSTATIMINHGIKVIFGSINMLWITWTAINIISSAASTAFLWWSNDCTYKRQSLEFETGAY